MDPKKCWISSIAVFLFISIYQFVEHQVILRALYQQHQELWNTPEVMNSRTWAIWAAQLVLSVLFVTIYTKGYEPQRGTVAQGLRYGFLMGLILCVPRELEVFMVFPFPVKLDILWAVAGVLQFVLAGALVGAIYKPAAAEPMPQLG